MTPSTQETAAASEPAPRRLYVCAGHRWNPDGGYMWVVLYRVAESGERSQDYDAFRAAKFQRLVWGGAVFSIGYDPIKENTIIIDPRFVRRWGNDADCAQWQALDRAALVEEGLAKEAKKSKDRDALAELLLPLREQYAKLIAQRDKRILELIVLEALRKRP